MFGINPSVILGFLVALLVTSLGSCEYGKHLQKQSDDLDYQKSVNQALRAKDERLIFLQNQLGDALNENAKLRQKNSADAAAARNSVTGLRQQLDSYRTGLRSKPQTASTQYASALADILGQCSVEYQQMAEAADGYAADVKLLQDAWPK